MRKSRRVMRAPSVHDVEVRDDEHLGQLVHVDERGDDGVFRQAVVVRAHLLDRADAEPRGVVSAETGGEQQIAVDQPRLIRQVRQLQPPLLHEGEVAHRDRHLARAEDLRAELRVRVEDRRDGAPSQTRVRDDADEIALFVHDAVADGDVGGGALAERHGRAPVARAALDDVGGFKREVLSLLAQVQERAQAGVLLTVGLRLAHLFLELRVLLAQLRVFLLERVDALEVLGDRAEPAADRRRGRAERLRHNARGVVEKPRRRPHRGQHAQHHRDQRRRGEDPDAVFGKEFFHVVGSSVQ